MAVPQIAIQSIGPHNLLLPQFTKAQRDAISPLATGMFVFQTDNTPGLRVYNGTNWIKFTEATD